MRYDAARFQRFCAQHGITRAHILTILVMATGYDTPVVRLLLDFAHGTGPAAVAAGRAR